MKTSILLFSIFFTFAQSALSAPSGCREKVMTAARFMWSVNSRIDMKDLTAEILSSERSENGHLDFSVVVNTPRFPRAQQKVPYNVSVVRSGHQGACAVTQVTALDE